MAYLDEEAEGGPPNPISKIGAVLFFMAVGFGLKLAATGNIFGARDEWTAARVDAELQAHPQSGELYRAIKTAYPGEYQAFLRPMTEAAKGGDRRAIIAAAERFSRQLMTTHFDGFTRAPTGRLVEIARQYALLSRTLQRADIGLCAQLYSTGPAPGAQPPAETALLFSHIGALQVLAARAGETRPGAAARAELTEPEQAALMDRIGRHSREAAHLLADRSAMLAATPAQQCAAGMAMDQAIAALPPEDAAKALVSSMRQTFGSAPVAGAPPAQ